MVKVFLFYVLMWLYSLHTHTHTRKNNNNNNVPVVYFENIFPRHRYNARGFDLNRNFPDYFKQNTKRLQPETEAYKEWIAKIQFTLSAGLHAGALVASYPFDNTPNSGKLNYISILISKY